VHQFWPSHKKMSLCEALHGRADIGRVGAPWSAMGKLAGEGGEGDGEEGEGAQLGCSWGAPWGLGPAAPLPMEVLPAHAFSLLRAVLWVR
jgi:hypothetical protein